MSKSDSSFDFIEEKSNNSFEICEINTIDKQLENKISHIEFDPTNNLIGVTSEIGFRIYKNQHKEASKEEGPNSFFKGSGFTKIRFLYATEIIALTTNNSVSKFPSSIIYFFDNKYKQLIKQYDFYKAIKNFIYLRDFLVVQSDQRIVLYNLKRNQPLKYFEQHVVLLSSSLNYDNFNFAYTIKNEQKVYFNDSWFNNNSELDTKTIISNIEVSKNGEMMAIVNEDGCNIQVYETNNLKFKYSLTRGNYKKTVSDLKFSDDNKYLALVSLDPELKKQSGTLHIFDLHINKSSSRKQVQFNLWDQQIFVGPFVNFKNNTVKIYSVQNFMFSYTIEDSEPQSFKIEENKKQFWLNN